MILLNYATDAYDGCLADDPVGAGMSGAACGTGSHVLCHLDTSIGVVHAFAFETALNQTVT